MKTIIFSHTYRDPFGEPVTEEFTFPDAATEEEIEEEFRDWVWETIGDHFTWHDKEDEEGDE